MAWNDMLAIISLAISIGLAFAFYSRTTNDAAIITALNRSLDNERHERESLASMVGDLKKEVDRYKATEDFKDMQLKQLYQKEIQLYERIAQLTTKSN